MITAHEGLARLREGNRRFIAGIQSRDAFASRAGLLVVGAQYSPETGAVEFFERGYRKAGRWAERAPQAQPKRSCPVVELIKGIPLQPGPNSNIVAALAPPTLEVRDGLGIGYIF